MSCLLVAVLGKYRFFIFLCIFGEASKGGRGRGIKGRSELLRKFIQNGAWRVRAENTFYFYIEPFGLIGSVKK